MASARSALPIPRRSHRPIRDNLALGANTVVVEARDGNNNFATQTYSVTTTYEYDANGNLRYEKQPNGTVTREYRWDQQNRLVRMLAGVHESVCDYDRQSRRVRITEKESGVQTKQETFIWCGARICQRRSGSTIVRSYFGQGFEQGSSDYVYARDHLGSVREVVGIDGMTMGSRVSYHPWGEVTETGSVLSDFTYTGHYYDRPTRLSLAWYRVYDSSLAALMPMKLSNLPCALTLRDSCFEAMDALNQGLVDCLNKLPGEEEAAVRVSVGCAMNGILEFLLEPLLKNHPELELPEDLWGDAARRRRLARANMDAAAEAEAPDPKR